MIKITEWAISDAVHVQRKWDAYNTAMADHETKVARLQERKDAGEQVTIPHKPKIEEPEELPGFLYSGAGPDARIFEVEATGSEGRLKVTEAVQKYAKSHKRPDPIYDNDAQTAAADAW